VFAERPDFLVISPPKTGTSWLADNFRCHPELFVPAIKEVKYFNSLHRVLGLDWYLSHFAPAGGRLAGDVSPSYASLPVGMIRRIRKQFPDLKLIFLMREPVARAWSHARHAHRFRELAFADAPPGPATAEQWRAVLADEWSLLSGDYLGHLRRWSAVFPSEQMLVGFYEDIAARPDQLLRRAFRFLGVNADLDLSAFPLRERINPGGAGDLPPDLRDFLRGLLGPRTEELVAFLRDRFVLRPPPEWRGTPPAGSAADPPPFARWADDEYVAAVAAREEQFPTAFREVERDYRGFDLVYYRGRLLGVELGARPGGVLGATTAAIDALVAEGRCLAADSLPALKERVTDHVLARREGRLEARVAALEARAEEASAEAGRGAAELARVVAELRRGSLATRVTRRVRRLAGRVASWVVAAGPA
jgi:hypothetical protein